MLQLWGVNRRTLATDAYCLPMIPSPALQGIPLVRALADTRPAMTACMAGDEPGLRVPRGYTRRTLVPGAQCDRTNHAPRFRRAQPSVSFGNDSPLLAAQLRWRSAATRGTPECRHIRHSELPKGCPEQACVTRLAASSCLVDLPAASIPIGLRHGHGKDPCSDSAGRNHARLSCLSVESASHVPEGKLCRRARGSADRKAV